MDTKTIERYDVKRFGFPVMIYNAPMRLRLGKWVLDVNANDLRNAVLCVLATKPSRLTGAEVRFIRQTQELSMQALGEQLGVSHVAVSKWEANGQNPAGMHVCSEFVVRYIAVEALPEKLATKIVMNGEELPIPEALRQVRRRLRSDDNARQEAIEIQPTWLSAA